MRPNAQIEVRWKIGDQEHAVVIKRGSKVSAIILNGPVLPDAGAPPGPEFEALRELDAGDGPLVCYEIGGQLHCW